MCRPSCPHYRMLNRIRVPEKRRPNYFSNYFMTLRNITIIIRRSGPSPIVEASLRDCAVMKEYPIGTLLPAPAGHPISASLCFLCSPYAHHDKH